LDSSIVQGLFFLSARRCQTLISRFATFASLYTCGGRLCAPRRLRSTLSCTHADRPAPPPPCAPGPALDVPQLEMRRVRVRVAHDACKGHRTAMENVANRKISGGRSLTAVFAADFPLHDCSPYRERYTHGAQVWELAIVQGPFSAPVPKPYDVASLYVALCAAAAPCPCRVPPAAAP
jgi:hypothetical protein